HFALGPSEQSSRAKRTKFTSLREEVNLVLSAEKAAGPIPLVPPGQLPQPPRCRRGELAWLDAQAPCPEIPDHGSRPAHLCGQGASGPDHASDCRGARRAALCALSPFREQGGHRGGGGVRGGLAARPRPPIEAPKTQAREAGGSAVPASAEIRGRVSAPVPAGGPARSPLEARRFAGVGPD